MRFPDDRSAGDEECEVMKALFDRVSRFPAHQLDRKTIVSRERRRVHSFNGPSGPVVFAATPNLPAGAPPAIRTLDADGNVTATEPLPKSAQPTRKPAKAGQPTNK